MKDSGLTPRVGARVVYLSKERPRTLYTVNDDQVTYWAQLDNNFLNDYKKFHIDWIEPSGKVFATKKLSLMWTTSNALVATLPIRDNYPSTLPGDWKVRLYVKDKLLDEARFTIKPGKQPRGKK